MFEDRRIQFPSPARQLEYNLVRHGLRLHLDNLLMITSSLLALRPKRDAAAQMLHQVEALADHIVEDLDYLDAMLPESLDATGADDADIHRASPPGDADSAAPPQG